MFTNIPLIINLAESGPLTWDMANQIIQFQNNLAMYGLTILVGVAAALITGTFIWNIFLRKHELKKAIESLKSEMTTKIEKEIQEKLVQGMKFFDAEKARLFALIAYQSKIWGKSAYWWALAIEGYSEIGNNYLLGLAVHGLEIALKNCTKLESTDKKEIEVRCSFIPEILYEKKNQIAKKLKEIPEETPT